jgi:zona occludens toxin (predicted ATPase)
MFTGTPGSGKSYHAAKKIQEKLRRGKNVISTMAVDVNRISKKGSKKIGTYEFMFIQELTPKYLYEFARMHHRLGREGQTLLVIDECQILFNPRDYSAKGRTEWILFFSYHRHYGYDIILVTQFDRLVDRQIRGQVETEFRHRKINNRGLLCLLPVTIFAIIEYWYVNKTRLGAHFVIYKRSVSKIYNSYETSEIIAQKLGVKAEWESDASCVVRPSALTPTTPDADPAPSGGGGRGTPPTRWAVRLRNWFANGLKTQA